MFASDKRAAFCLACFFYFNDISQTVEYLNIE